MNNYTYTTTTLTFKKAALAGQPVVASGGSWDFFV